MSKKSVLEMLKNAVEVKAVYVGYTLEDIPNMDNLLKEKYPEHNIINRNDRTWYVVNPLDEDDALAVVPHLPKERIGKMVVKSTRYSFVWVNSVGVERNTGGEIKNLIKVDDSSVKIVCFNGDEIIYSVA